MPKWFASGQIASNVPCVQSVQINVNLEESEDCSVDATDLTLVHSNGQLMTAAIGQEVKMKFFGQRSVGTNVNVARTCNVKMDGNSNVGNVVQNYSMETRIDEANNWKSVLFTPDLHGTQFQAESDIHKLSLHGSAQLGKSIANIERTITGVGSKDTKSSLTNGMTLDMHGDRVSADEPPTQKAVFNFAARKGKKAKKECSAVCRVRIFDANGNQREEIMQQQQQDEGVDMEEDELPEPAGNVAGFGLP